MAKDLVLILESVVYSGKSIGDDKDGEIYIHTGTYSLGCITLIENNKWDALYSVLIKSRVGDDRSIAVLEVID